MDLKELKPKLIGDSDNRAVSPVIGVVLMVAVTVILAATIAAFVMDMGGGMGTEANAGVQTNVGNNSVDATWGSQGNSDEIVVQAEIVDSENAEENYVISYGDGETWDESSSDPAEATLSEVGDSETFTVLHAEDADGNSYDEYEGDEVTVSVEAVAHSSDSTTVVQETTETVVAGDQ